MIFSITFLTKRTSTTLKVNLYDSIAAITQQWADERVENAKGILEKYGVRREMQLPASIANYQRVGKSGILIEFYANDYYIYVDQGVKGIGFNQGVLVGRNTKFNKKVSAFGVQRSALTTGKYSYKTPFVSRKMVQNISDWIPRAQVLVRKDTSESSKGSVIPRKEQLAWAIAKNIKRTGIGKTLFWSDTFDDDAFVDLANRIAPVVGGQITITI